MNFHGVCQFFIFQDFNQATQISAGCFATLKADGPMNSVYCADDSGHPSKASSLAVIIVTKRKED